MELLSSHRAEHSEVASGDREVTFKHWNKNKLWGLDTIWATRSCPHFCCVVPHQLCHRSCFQKREDEPGWKIKCLSFLPSHVLPQHFPGRSNSSGDASVFKGYLRLEVWFFSKNLNPALSCSVKVKSDFLMLCNSSRFTDFGEGRIPPRSAQGQDLFPHPLPPLQGTLYLTKVDRARQLFSHVW